MSRVEDDRQAKQAAERLLQEKRLNEAKAKSQREGESAFSRLVQQQQTQQKQQPQSQPRPAQNLGQAVLARATQQGAGGYGALLGQAGKSFEERMQPAATSGQPGSLAQQEQVQQQQVHVGRREDHQVQETRTEARSSESLEESDATSERTAEAGLSRASQNKGSLKLDSGSGGGGKGGGQDKEGKGGETAAAAGFRFNPALMAPVPVAQPKPTSGSERLRAIANEIAQKIVERVRVGTNAAGQAEFQMDLRGDVLSGLSIKISARNGKIQATFSGSDRDVMKLLQEQSEGLRAALGKRGLTLEDVRFEAKS